MKVSEFSLYLTGLRKISGTGGCESNADTMDAIIGETLGSITSERTSRVIDQEATASMERRKREGYF